MIDIQIPGYEIIEQLGLGGMARVYRARHINLDRDVAIKIMDAALNSDPTFAERFKREARIAARLTHPNIVQVYDVDSWKEINYLAMEYISQGDLIRIIRGPVDIYQIYQVVLQITQALDYASGMGYVHRDIKPSNILVRENGSFVLADFGIARAAESSTQMTMTGSVIGTPSYMSPEQAQGSQLDGRSDLYSLAIVCFEMLTRELPYKADSSISTALKHLTDPIPTLAGNLAIFQPFFNRAMAKKPAERFQSGADMARALGQILDSESGQTVIASREAAIQTRPTPIPGSRLHTPAPGMPSQPGDHPFQGTGENRPSGAIAATRPPEKPSGGGLFAGSGQSPALGPASGTPSPSHRQPELTDDLSSYRNDYRKSRAQTHSSGAWKWIATAALAMVIAGATASWVMLAPEKRQALIAAVSGLVGGTSKADTEALLARAVAAYQAGKLFQPRGESAYDYYQQVIEADPDNSTAAEGLATLLSATVDRAMDYIEQDRLEIARQQLDKAALIDASNAYLLSARKSLTTATNHSAARREKQGQVANLLAQAGRQLERGQLVSPDQDNARDSFLAALALDPGNEDARDGLASISSTYLGRADIATRKGRYEDAGEYLQVAAAITPGDPRIAQYRRSLQAAQDAGVETSPAADDGGIDQALVNELLEEAQLAIAQGRSDPDARDRARLLWQEVLQLDPENAKAEQGLADLYEHYMAIAEKEKEKGNYQAARRAFDGARAIDPSAQLEMPSGSVAERLAAAQAHEAAGDYKAAATVYLEVLVAEPGNADIDAALHRLSGLYMTSIQQHVAAGEFDQAAALQAEALRWFPNSAQLASILDDPGPAQTTAATDAEPAAATQAGPKPESRPAPQDIDHDPGELDDSEKIASLLERADRYTGKQQLFRPEGENAYAAYRKVLEIDSNNATAKQGLNQLAYDSAQRVKDDLQADDVAAAKAHLADLKKVGASDMAIRLLDNKIRRKEAELAEIAAAQKQLNTVTRRAYLAIDDGDLDAARNLYQQAVSLGSDEPDVLQLQAALVEAHHEASRVALSQQNYSDAIATAEHGLLLAPDDASLISVKDDALTALSTE